MTRDAMPSSSTEWQTHEATILEALERLRALATTGPSPAAHASVSLEDDIVDVVHGSAGAWHAWWTRLDLAGGAEVAAIVPDLRPLHAIADGDSDEHGRDLLAALASGRIRVRLLLPTAARDDARARGVVDLLTAAGIEVRTDNARGWYFVASGRVAVVPRTWADDTDDAEVDTLVVATPTLVAALGQLYTQRWAAATPWGEAPDAVDAVLRALEAGHDDAEVAAELGISVRTVRRRVAWAMAAAGARSRYELAHLRASRARH